MSDLCIVNPLLVSGDGLSVYRCNPVDQNLSALVDERIPKFGRTDSCDEQTSNSITLNCGANYGVRRGLLESNMQLYAKQCVITC